MMKKHKPTSGFLRPVILITVVLLLAIGIFLMRSPSFEETPVIYNFNMLSQNGLVWLHRHQNEDGCWSLNEDAKEFSCSVEATGLALLAFLSQGETPVSAEYGTTVAKALRYLVEHQDENEDFASTDTDQTYGQEIAGYALAEAYLMTDNPLLREPVSRALYRIIKEAQTSI